LTSGEVMQLPPEDEIVMVSGCPPIRAKKARYYEDPELAARILPPPHLGANKPALIGECLGASEAGDWAGVVITAEQGSDTEDPANAGIRREPELPEHEEVAPEPRKPVQEFEPIDDEPDDEIQRQRTMQRAFGSVVRQVPLDPGDDLRM
ncbi:MAG: type IV secretory system conjugative DNA transfer family protein, partial [Stellaceae bacterium]